jgi:hypothetical protein
VYLFSAQPAKVNLSLFFIKHETVKAYEGVEVFEPYIYNFLDGRLSVPCSGNSTPEETAFGAHRIRVVSWRATTAGVDALNRREISCHWRETKEVPRSSSP